jgi:DNA-binding FadR family transcriptional regulator
LVDNVYRQVFDRISRGQYPPDSKLPSENELSTQFSVSRPIVRDALKRLRDNGLIASRQGSRSYVLAQPKEKILSFAPVGTLADIQRCYEFRETIETVAAYWAAKRRNEAALENLHALLKKLQSVTASRIYRNDLDFEFHLAIAAASNNPHFVTVLNALREQIEVGMRLYGMAILSPAGDLDEPADEHQQLYDAIKVGDADHASDVMRRHITNARKRLFGGTEFDLKL